MTSSVLDFFKNLVGGSDDEDESEQPDIQASPMEVKTDGVDALQDAVAQAQLECSGLPDSKESSDRDEPQEKVEKVEKKREVSERFKRRSDTKSPRSRARSRSTNSGNGQEVKSSPRSRSRSGSDGSKGSHQSRGRWVPKGSLTASRKGPIVPPKIRKARSLTADMIDLRPQTKLRSPSIASNASQPAMPAQVDAGIQDQPNAPEGTQKKAKYMPPAARSRGTSIADRNSGSTASSSLTSSGLTSSGDQERFRSWCNWDNKELEKRKRALIGKTVVGKLSPKRGNRYFIKWNISANDTVVIGADKVEEILGDTPPAGMWVSCTIVGLGPSHVQWNKQHPYAMALESRETRASHQPGKGRMPRNSPHWKKAQKAGLTRQVTSPVDQRATVPAEIDMSRYAPKPKPVAPRMVQTLPSFPSVGIPRAAPVPTGVTHKVRPDLAALRSMPMSKPIVPKPLVKPVPHFAAHVQRATADAAALQHAANNGSVNLVTGEVKPRGRADSAASWRRDRSYTV